MIPRYGEAIVPRQRYRQRPGAYVILPRDGALLLTVQEDGHGLGIQLPGGGIDPGESPMAALYREVLEETGWTISQPRRVGAYRRFCYMPEYDKWAEKLCTVYLARPCRAIQQPSEPHHYTIWLPAEEATSKLESEGSREVLRHVMQHHGVV